MVLSVLEKLQAELGDVYQLDNLILAATHTHAVPGGYWHNGADTPLGSPFNPEHFQALVDGIASFDRRRPIATCSRAQSCWPSATSKQAAPSVRATPTCKTPADERDRYASRHRHPDDPARASSATASRSACSTGMPCIPPR